MCQWLGHTWIVLVVILVRKGSTSQDVELRSDGLAV